MKKSVSIVYTVFVIVTLLSVIGYFGWRNYQIRESRISDFTARATGYTEKLSNILVENRDVKKEMQEARKILEKDIPLVAVQVYSHDDGVRFSVVRSEADEYIHNPIEESGKFGKFPANITYLILKEPMNIENMRGLEAIYVAKVLTDSEIKNTLFIILITVAALFAVTLLLIFVKPGGTEQYNVKDDTGDSGETFQDTDNSEEISDEEFTLPDLSNDDFSFEEPEQDELPEETANTDSSFRERLEKELERSASFNQDLSLLIFSGNPDADNFIKDFFKFDDLIFKLTNGNTAVIEVNRDLDSSMAVAEEMIKEYINKTFDKNLKAGISSRNGRLINAENLITEAESALQKTTGEETIVGFRSDPEKYRIFIREQED